MQAVGLLTSDKSNTVRHIDRLVNTNPKTFKDVLLLLNDLANCVKPDSSPNTNTLSSTLKTPGLNLLLDDFLTFEFPNTAKACQPADWLELDDLLSKKITVLDDENCLREFKNMMMINKSRNFVSLIPNDLARVVKTINEHSDYLNSIGDSKDYLSTIQELMVNVKEEIEAKKSLLYSVTLE